MNKWIPVTERLPENNRGKHVLVTTVDEGCIDVRAAYFAFDKFFRVEAHSIYEDGVVKAWMPLPEPYDERRMSEYGGCTLSFCNWMDDPYEPNYCEDCPYYDPDMFRQEAKDESDG